MDPGGTLLAMPVGLLFALAATIKSDALQSSVSAAQMASWIFMFD
jgi:hypothetical protein